MGPPPEPRRTCRPSPRRAGVRRARARPAGARSEVESGRLRARSGNGPAALDAVLGCLAPAQRRISPHPRHPGSPGSCGRRAARKRSRSSTSSTLRRAAHVDGRRQTRGAAANDDAVHFARSHIDIMDYSSTLVSRRPARAWRPKCRSCFARSPTRRAMTSPSEVPRGSTARRARRSTAPRASQTRRSARRRCSAFACARRADHEIGAETSRSSVRTNVIC
jgi:hypothetical protein